MNNDITNYSVKNIIREDTPIINIHKKGIPITKKTLKELSIEKIRLQLWNNWVKIDNDYFYYKDINYIYTFLQELIGEQISKYFELDTVHYEIGKIENRKNNSISYGLLSKNFLIKDKKYLEASDFQFGKYSNFDLFKYLEEYNIDDCNTLLISDLKKMLIRDFYANQKDRHTTNNFFLQVDDGKLRLSPLHDYEYSFEEVSLIYCNLFAKINLEDKKTRTIIQNDKEFFHLIQKILLLDMKKILNDIEKIYQINISSYHKNYFIDYDEQMKENILNLKI